MCSCMMFSCVLAWCAGMGAWQTATRSYINKLHHRRACHRQCRTWLKISPTVYFVLCLISSENASFGYLTLLKMLPGAQ